MKNQLATAGLICALIAGCGGGGNESAPSPDTPNQPSSLSAEGRWVGQIDNDTHALINVLENGEIWGFYASSPTEGGNLYGQLSVEGSSFKGTLTDINRLSSMAASTGFTGQISPEVKLDFTLPNQNGFSLAYDAQYERAADAAALPGSYQGTSFHVRHQKSSGESGTTSANTSSTISAALTVSESGEAVLSFSPNCSMTGTILPRPSGKDIFDASLTYHGDLCLQDHGTLVQGIATLENDTGALHVLTLNEDKTIRFTFVAEKQG